MGMRVGPYVVTSTLGQGTFGKVRLATHSESGVEYAIKVLDKNAIQANELADNVRREIAIMKALTHRNIVNLREVLSSRSKLYIVMDLVRGGELFDQIERSGELDARLARSYFQQLVDGVEYCHRRGVFHRDLKPENLLVDQDGTLKITDFGVSSMTPANNELLYTACGTPFYCAPEIINGADDGYVGAKVDAWSCGIILFLLLTGKLPFFNEDMNSLYQQIDRCEVEYPQWLDEDAKDLISRLLVKDASKRYSLADVKLHPWFLVDYVPADADESEPRATSQNKTQGGASPTSPMPPNPNPPQQPITPSLKGALKDPEDTTPSRLTHAATMPSQLDEQRTSPRPVDKGAMTAPALVSPSAPDPTPASDTVISQTPAPAPSPMLAPETESSPTPMPEPAQANGLVPAPEPEPEPESELVSKAEPAPKAPPPRPAPTPVNKAALEKEAPQPPRKPAQRNGTEGRRRTPASNGRRALRDVTSYEGEDMALLIKDALPGKSAKRVAKIVEDLAELDVECCQDIAFLASMLKTPAALAAWLEEKSPLPTITSMRLAAFFFV